MVRLGSHPADVELAEAVARAVGDPTLVLAVPDADGQLVDLGGQPVAPPAPDRRVTRVEAGDELLAVLIHDVGLDANPGLMRSVAAATRLALENRRLTATVQHQLEDVRASRARIVEASDAERERIERNLHDGAQQRLVTLALRLRMHRRRRQRPSGGRSIEAAADELDEALAELRDLARGIHPTAVVQGGLASAVEALAERTPLPVTVRVPAERWPVGIEVAAYFVVAEALTNAVRHAQATQADVTVIVEDGRLRVSITDDGIGGADAGAGTGLGGLADRLAALGGGLEVVSPPGGGTVVRARPAARDPMRVVLADDQALLRESLAEALAARGIEVVGQAEDVPGSLALVERTQPDVAIVDIRMPPSPHRRGPRGRLDHPRGRGRASPSSSCRTTSRRPSRRTCSATTLGDSATSSRTG